MELDIKPDLSEISSQNSDPPNDMTADLDDQRFYTKKAVRFRAKHDIFLLKCVLARNPFSCRGPGGSKYLNELIAADMNKVFKDEFIVCHRRVRERYQLLLKQFQEGDIKRRSRTDTDSEFQEKVHLLQECSELQLKEEKASRVYMAHRKDLEKVSAIPIKINNAEDTIHAASSFSASLSPDEDSNQSHQSPPMKKRKSNSYNSDLVDYFQNKDAEEKCYKEKELELKERELKLKERELALREQELEWKMQQAAGDQTGKAALLSLLMSHLK